MERIKGLTSQHMDFLLSNNLFAGIEESDLLPVLSYLSARIEKYERNDVIVTSGEPIRPGIFLRGSGRIALYLSDDYTELTDNFTAGMSFGIPTACSDDSRAGAFIVASRASEVIRMDVSPLIDVKEGDLPHFHSVIAGNFIRKISRQALENLTHLRIISHHNIRSRILMYLYSQAQDEDGKIRVHLSMGDLALYLNTDRSYLYKEVRALNEEGIVEWSGRNVRLLSTPPDFDSIT